MDRRGFLTGAGGLSASLIVAGCTGTGGDNEQTGNSPDEGGQSSGTTDTEDAPSGRQELPAIEDVLGQHQAVLAELSCAAEDRSSTTNSEREDADVAERVFRSGPDGTLIEETRNGQTEREWYSGHSRVTSERHRYESERVEPSFISRREVSGIVEIAGPFERVDVINGDVQRAVFEATEPADESADGESYVIHEVDVRVAVAEPGYVHSFEGTVTYAESADSDRTATVTYEFDVTDTGDVTVEAPAFVDDAIRVHGSMADDGSALALEHMGGPTVPASTEIILESVAADDDEMVLDTEFAPGDEAYVYWTGAEEASIDVGEPPGDVSRSFSRTESGNWDVYLWARTESGRGNFMVDISSSE